MATDSAIEGCAEGLAESLICPECGRLLGATAIGFACVSCQSEYHCQDGIPVLTPSPTDSTESLSADEVSLALTRIKAMGWGRGLCATLARLNGSRSEGVFSEFVDLRGVLVMMMVGGPHQTSVLCLGCSATAVPFFSAQRFPHLTVCDSSMGRLKLLRARSIEAGHDNMFFVCGGNTAYLPLSTDAFDLVLVDAVAIRRSTISRPSFWSEVVRVLRPSGACLITAPNKWDPRRLMQRISRDRNEQGLTPGIASKMLQRAGLSCRQVLGVMPNSRAPKSVFDLGTRRTSRTVERMPRLRDRVKSLCLHNRFFIPAFAVLACDDELSDKQWRWTHSKGYVQRVLDATSEILNINTAGGAVLHARRIDIRQSGRIVISASCDGAKDKAVIIKVPCTPWLVERETRNADALCLLHADDRIPPEIRRLVPQHLGNASLNGQTFFVEELLPGVERGTADTGANHALALSWRRKGMPRSPVYQQFANVLWKLHRITSHFVTIGEAEFAGVRQSLNMIRRWLVDRRQTSICDAVLRLLERELLGQRLPLVWSHGDVGCNYLEGRSGSLVGIIDWETFDPNGFPLQDWILLALSRSGLARRQRWERMAMLLDGTEGKFFEGLPFEEYMESLYVGRHLVPALAVLVWVRYASDRLPRRGYDPKWLDAVVFHVLRLLDERGL